MAAWVTFKNGVVVKYNNCNYLNSVGDDFTLCTQKLDPGWIAVIPRENIERFEFERPCATYRNPRKDKLRILK